MRSSLCLLGNKSMKQRDEMKKDGLTDEQPLFSGVELSRVLVAAGKSERSILQKLEHLSSRQQQMEQQHLAAGGGATDPADGDVSEDIITSSYLLLKPEQAPPTSAPVQTIVQQPQPSAHRVLQVVKPTLTPPDVSHNASALQLRPKRVPNILSRCKNPAPPTAKGKTELRTHDVCVSS